MKKTWIILSLLSIMVCGCSTASAPLYISDRHPYKYSVYAPFDEVLDKTLIALKDGGWDAVQQADPSLYERRFATDQTVYQQTLIFCKPRIKKTAVGLKNERLNVLLRSRQDSSVEIEFRYLVLTSLPFTKLYGYRSDKAIEKLFHAVESRLNQN